MVRHTAPGTRHFEALLSVPVPLVDLGPGNLEPLCQTGYLPPVPVGVPLELLLQQCLAVCTHPLLVEDLDSHMAFRFARSHNLVHQLLQILIIF